ncbi:hypothetical protein E4P39_06615 [Blastococcus sp. CT_GayMR19]|uniref:DUF5655 domain-containing protein n=1 Tax=Blastococcus sp. CT_GayMR19 TaxID=2559608 RepID=UPI0010733907|nr:DUF5655 domain-containing protein [Blastococcus sp. CT_GayMR19]TFV77627.1 hypothetical protein E4P39_06615 [Blastococcus sp. CT_GayMR19]
MRPEDLFAGHPVASAVLRAVLDLADGLGDVETRTSRSQVALRHRRGFAHLWRPGQYLARPAAEIVLSVVLDRHDDSTRWKEVAHPAPTSWMHHLEVADAAEIDDEVARWLREAADLAC